MRLALIIVGLLVIAVTVTVLLRTPPEPGGAPRDLPWQVEVLGDGSTRVFDMTLGESTLADLSAKLGNPRGLALFESPDGSISLEAYFGTVELGPFSAKLVANLAATAEELGMLLDHSKHVETTPSGSIKYLLPENLAHEQQQRVINALTYIPSYSSLDTVTLRQHFGDPAREVRLDGKRVRWFYPSTGVDILIDEEGKEVIQYQLPAQPAKPGAYPPGSGNGGAAPGDPLTATPSGLRSLAVGRSTR
jgi:hypothetical protein